MAEKLTLSFTTPYAELAERDVDEVVLPAVEGEIGILAGHDAMMSILDIGKVTVRDGSKSESYFVAGGYFEVSDDKLLLLAEVAEAADQIDLERAQSALKRAEDRVAHTADDDIDSARAGAALKRAQLRIEVAKAH